MEEEEAAKKQLNIIEEKEMERLMIANKAETVKKITFDVSWKNERQMLLDRAAARKEYNNLHKYEDISLNHWEKWLNEKYPLLFTWFEVTKEWRLKDMKKIARNIEKEALI